jgi:pyruvate dehydrogenase E2 component (dihydrolipoamide acetyltransferase)
VDVILPKWGVSMQEGTISEWRVEEGAQVAEGDPIAAVVTDKVDADLEAPVAGTLVKRLVEAGDTVPVGSVVAVIEET